MQINLSKVIHQGVGPELKNHIYHRMYHSFYQWVPLVLLIFATAFYLPRFAWKRLEGGVIQLLVKCAEKDFDDLGLSIAVRIYTFS